MSLRTMITSALAAVTLSAGPALAAPRTCVTVGQDSACVTYGQVHHSPVIHSSYQTRHTPRYYTNRSHVAHANRYTRDVRYVDTYRAHDRHVHGAHCGCNTCKAKYRAPTCHTPRYQTRHVHGSNCGCNTCKAKYHKPRHRTSVHIGGSYGYNDGYYSRGHSRSNVGLSISIGSGGYGHGYSRHSRGYDHGGYYRASRDIYHHRSRRLSRCR